MHQIHNHNLHTLHGYHAEDYYLLEKYYFLFLLKKNHLAKIGYSSPFLPKDQANIEEILDKLRKEKCVSSVTKAPLEYEQMEIVEVYDYCRRIDSRIEKASLFHYDVAVVGSLGDSELGFVPKGTRPEIFLKLKDSPYINKIDGVITAAGKKLRNYFLSKP